MHFSPVTCVVRLETEMYDHSCTNILTFTSRKCPIFMQIGQGTYSSVYRARDLTTNKIVAMKLVRFSNMDPDSVRFMAREICILRRLDHTNVMKLEALVTSRISGSLYLVFEYMEHDLAGLLASLEVKFTEAQVCTITYLLLITSLLYVYIKIPFETLSIHYMGADQMFC